MSAGIVINLNFLGDYENTVPSNFKLCCHVRKPVDTALLTYFV